MFLIHFLSSLSLLVTSSFVAFSSVPVNSIVFLISTFISAALMLFFFGVDFLSLIFIIVYVGAIAILFLFVVMMVSIKTKIVNTFSIQSLLNLLKGVWLYFFLFFILLSFFNIIFSKENYYLVEIHSIVVDNIESIILFGQILFNNFSIVFLISGLLLCFSLAGATLLCSNGNGHSQNFFFWGYFFLLKPYLKGRLDSALSPAEKIKKESIIANLVDIQIILEGLTKDLNLACTVDRKRDEADLKERFLGFRKPNPKVFDKNIFWVDSRVKARKKYLYSWILAHERSQIALELKFAKFMERPISIWFFSQSEDTQTMIYLLFYVVFGLPYEIWTEFFWYYIKRYVPAFLAYYFVLALNIGTY